MTFAHAAWVTPIFCAIFSTSFQPFRRDLHFRCLYLCGFTYTLFAQAIYVCRQCQRTIRKKEGGTTGEGTYDNFGVRARDYSTVWALRMYQATPQYRFHTKITEVLVLVFSVNVEAMKDSGSGSVRFSREGFIWMIVCGVLALMSPGMFGSWKVKLEKPADVSWQQCCVGLSPTDNKSRTDGSPAETISSRVWGFSWRHCAPNVSVPRWTVRDDIIDSGS